MKEKTFFWKYSIHQREQKTRSLTWVYLEIFRSTVVTNTRLQRGVSSALFSRSNGKNLQDFLSTFPLAVIERKSINLQICETGFKLLSSFKAHVNRHSKTKDVDCKICGKLFYTKSNLKEHMLTHTGEKNHQCASCGNLTKFHFFCHDSWFQSVKNVPTGYEV